MSGIQWLLLILVVAAVAGAYLYLRRHSGADPWRDMEDSGEPDDIDRGVSLGGDSYIVGVRTLSSGARAEPPPEGPTLRTESSPDAGQAGDWLRPAPEPGAARQPARAEATTRADANRAEPIRPRGAPSGDQRLFVLHVAHRDQRLFDGVVIHQALQAERLQFGLNEIYHRVCEINGVPESVFAIANSLKPGFLDPLEQDQLQTPGLTLFLQLPGPVEAARAVRDLLETASNLAEALGAEVLDDRRSLLKPQMAQHMLDEAAEFDRRQRLAGQR